MKRFKGNSIRACLVATLSLLPLATATLAQEVKIPFLFTDDDKLDQTSDLIAVIPKFNDLQADTFLNAPMTRLEYMLTKLEAHIDSKSDTYFVRDPLSEGFEPHLKSDDFSVSITSYAKYARELGRIIVGYRIEGLGRPKKPMRATCDKILSGLEATAPQVDFGYLYYNTVLGVLTQEMDNAKYSPSLRSLAKSMVYSVTLESHREEAPVGWTA